MVLDLRDDTPLTIQDFFDGVHFPATKEDLIRVAWDNKAPQELMDLLERFDDADEFPSPEAITHAYEDVRISESQRRTVTARRPDGPKLSSGRATVR